MKISHSELVKLIRECMMEVGDDIVDHHPHVRRMMYNQEMPTSKSWKQVSHERPTKGRMLDYGHVMSDSEEGRMAKGNLHNIARMAHEMKNMLHDEDDLPEWLQEKIATVKDRLESCYSYLHHELSELEED